MMSATQQVSDVNLNPQAAKFRTITEEIYDSFVEKTGQYVIDPLSGKKIFGISHLKKTGDIMDFIDKMKFFYGEEVVNNAFIARGVPKRDYASGLYGYGYR